MVRRYEYLTVMIAWLAFIAPLGKITGSEAPLGTPPHTHQPKLRLEGVW